MEASKDNLFIRITEVFLYFLKLGCTGFGGPIAVITTFQKDLIQNKKWMNEDRFLGALSVIKALPGPTATQVAIHLGKEKAGILGGLIAGTTFIFPSFLLMILIGKFYSTIESYSEKINATVFGFQAIALGVVLFSCISLSKPFRGDRLFILIAAISFSLTKAFPQYEPLIILGFGALGVLVYYSNSIKNKLHLFASIPLLETTFLVSNTQHLSSQNFIWDLFHVMFMSSAAVFGTGLAIVPALFHKVVEQYHWISSSEFSLALALGQMTPGPVTITATFIGYRVAGLMGAISASIGIFLIAFINMLTWFPKLENRMLKSKGTQMFTRFATAAVVGAVAETTIFLILKLQSTATFSNIALWILVMMGFILSFFKIPAWAIIPIGGLGFGVIQKFL